MNIKKLLFALSSVSVLALTSCGGSGFKHTTSKYLKAYRADLNQDETSKTRLNCQFLDRYRVIEAYDNLIFEANSMAELNEIANNLNIDENEPKRTSLARYEILHEAEELLMSTGAIVPLYNYGDPYLLKPNLTGIYTMNLGYKFLDRLEWAGHSNNFTVSVGTKAESFDPGINSDVSTTIAMNQFLIGAKRYVDGGQDPLEKEGIHIAVLGEGVCDVDKKLVVATEAEEDENHIWYENCPMSILESIALGTPALGSNIGGIPELIIKDYNGKIFTPNNVDELINSIQLLYYNNNELKKYKTNCLSTNNLYSNETYNCKLYNIYLDVISNR